ncbi:hypothetical protein BOTBODRAFT_113812, partial [Botryobasidium botryosum FD-172 SS1]
TLRQHCEAHHKNDYLKWCKKNDFVPQLPGMKKLEVLASESRAVQQSIADFAVKTEKPIPYSDDAFRAAAIEWLTSTNQPLDAFDNPRFKTMIDIASRAKGEVELPACNAIRKEIIQLFNDHLAELRQRLNVRLSSTLMLSCR